jgi:serine/threonine protein kinase
MDRGYSQNAKELVAKLLHKDPEVRLRLRTAMNHHWFRDKLDANNYSEVEVRDDINLLETDSPSKQHARKALGGSRSMNRQAAGTT